MFCEKQRQDIVRPIRVNKNLTVEKRSAIVVIEQDIKQNLQNGKHYDSAFKSRPQPGFLSFCKKDPIADDKKKS